MLLTFLEEVYHWTESKVTRTNWIKRVILFFLEAEDGFYWLVAEQDVALFETSVQLEPFAWGRDVAEPFLGLPESLVQLYLDYQSSQEHLQTILFLTVSEICSWSVLTTTAASQRNDLRQTKTRRDTLWGLDFLRSRIHMQSSSFLKRILLFAALFQQILSFQVVVLYFLIIKIHLPRIILLFAKTMTQKTQVLLGFRFTDCLDALSAAGSTMSLCLLTLAKYTWLFVTILMIG